MNSNTVNLNRKYDVEEMKKGTKYIFTILIILVIIMVLVSASTFTVNEHEQAIVKRFGVIQRIIIDEDNTFIEDYPETLAVEGAKLTNAKVVEGKGLFFRIPFIDKVEKFDSWLFTYVSSTEKVYTYEKNQYIITMYAQWRIANPGLFAIKLHTEKGASQYLDNMIFPEIIQNINNTTSKDFINNKELWNSKMLEAQNSLNEQIRESGVEILDMQVHRTILPTSNLQSTYDKMIANREKKAQQARSEGEAFYTKQVASADRKAREAIAGAILESEEIIGDGDAQALEIYANAYSIDREFYGYWRSLQALETSLKNNTTLVLDQHHPLWEGLLDMVAN